MTVLHAITALLAGTFVFAVAAAVGETIARWFDERRAASPSGRSEEGGKPWPDYLSNAESSYPPPNVRARFSMDLAQTDEFAIEEARHADRPGPR